MMTFEEQVKKAGFELAELKEAFIIEEITPYLKDNTLKQKLRLRLQEKKDWKDEVKESFKNCATVWDYVEALKELLS